MTALALAVTAAGIVCAIGVAARAGPRTAVPVLLDFLLAAGLLRLTATQEWDRIAATALIVIIRHIVSAGLSLGAFPSKTWRTTGRLGAPTSNSPPPP